MWARLVDKPNAEILNLKAPISGVDLFDCFLFADAVSAELPALIALSYHRVSSVGLQKLSIHNRQCSAIAVTTLLHGAG